MTLEGQVLPGMQDLLEKQLSRRQLLQQLGGGMGMLSAASLLAANGDLSAANAVSSAGTHFPPRAKRVIHLFMNGGPFGADLFDPKPALVKYEGQKPAGAKISPTRR